MDIHINNSLFLLFFILFLPQFYLLFIFTIMDLSEWFDKIFKKFTDYDFILYIIINPFILIGLIIYLYMSIG